MQSIQPLGLRSGLSLFFLIFFLFSLQAQPSAVFRVHFDLAEYVLPDAATTAIHEKAGKIEHPGQFRVQLIGHTDRRGSLDYNQALSERRAASVKAELIKMGFPGERIKMEGLAFLDPLSDSGTEPAMARNRRVEVIIEAAHWNVESTYYSVPAKAPSEIVYQRSGTKIQIPADAFTYPDGSPVSGEVLVQYREFRDAADFMASRIPMQFDYEGAPAYFNSTGMFEIRAYDTDGQALNLQPNKELTLDFVQTQLAEGTQFWQFDEKQQTWTLAEEMVAFDQDETRPVSLGKKMSKLGELKLFWPEKSYFEEHPDTLAELQAAYELLPEILQTSSQYGKHAYNPALDFRTFHERYQEIQTYGAYAGTQYTGHLPWRKIYSDKELYNIRFRAGWSKGRQAFFRLEDLSGSNVELQAFDEYAWKIKSKDLKLLRAITKGAKSKFADIRIKKNRKNRNWLIIELKYKRDLIQLAARPYTKEGQPVDQGLVQSQYGRYQQLLTARKKAFDQKIAANREKAMLVWPCVKLLLPRKIEDDVERLDAIDLAIREDQYATLTWPGTNSAQLNDFRWFTNLANGMHFVCGSSHLFTKELTQPNPNWRELLDNFQGEMYGSKDLFINVQTAFDDPVPRLRIRGLGIFNCDVLQRFEEEHELLARFQDDRGRDLDFRRVEVINHDLNGLLSFNSGKIALDLVASNSIIVYATDGRIFHLPSKDMAKLDLGERKKFVFQVNDIGDYTGNPEVLRKLLDDNS